MDALIVDEKLFEALQDAESRTFNEALPFTASVAYDAILPMLESAKAKPRTDGEVVGENTSDLARKETSERLQHLELAGHRVYSTNSAFWKAAEAVANFRSKNGTHWTWEVFQLFLDVYLPLTRPERESAQRVDLSHICDQIDAFLTTSEDEWGSKSRALLASLSKELRIAALSDGRVDIPGWKLVPEQITKEMQDAYFAAIDTNLHRVETDIYYGRYDNNREAYAAMLKAAPTPPSDIREGVENG